MKDEKGQPEPPLSDVDAAKTIPKTMHSKAIAILTYLKAIPDCITRDKTEQVKIEIEIIPGSNISDLVSDAMTSRKNFNPAGSKEFSIHYHCLS